DFVTANRWYGLMGATAILNHAVKHDGMPVRAIHEEQSRVGWPGKLTLSYEEVARETEGKLYLYLGPEALNDVMRRFLAERFPEPSRFEADAPAPAKPRRTKR